MAQYSNLKRYDSILDDSGNVDYSKAISNAIINGESAEKVQTYLDLRNQKISANPNLSQYANDDISQTAQRYVAENGNKNPEVLTSALQSQYSGPNSSYAQALRKQQEATDKATQKAVSELSAQKETTNKSYADMFRQLYQNKMLAKKNINEQLASQGITGGMAESTMLGLHTDYEEALRQGESARIDAQNQLDRAISDVKLDGDITKAEAEAESVRDAADSYAGVLASLINRYDSHAAQEKADAETTRTASRSLALSMLELGVMPSADTLKKAGISTADAETIVAQVKANKQNADSVNTTIPDLSERPVETPEEAVNYTPEQIRSQLSTAGYIDVNDGTMSLENWSNLLKANPSLTIAMLNKAGVYVADQSIISPESQKNMAEKADIYGGLPAELWDSIEATQPGITSQLSRLGYYRRTE